MKRFIFFIILFALSVSSSYTQNANHIRKVSFQGILKNTDGTIKPNNTYTITFSFFKNETGGTAVFSESAPVATVNGFFTHEIGSVNSLEDSIFYSQVYLQIQVAGDPNPITPRVTITPSPYSFYAHRAYEAERLIGGGGGGWGLSGNNVGANDFLGTTNISPLIIKVNNSTRLAITDAGNLSTSGLLSRLGLGAIDLQYSDNLSDDSLVAEGDYSFTVGFHNRAVGTNSLALGGDNRTYGQSSLAIGVANTATNEGAIGIGLENIISSYESDGLSTGVAIGGYNEGVRGSLVLGNNNSSNVEFGLAIGQFNIIRTNSEPSGISMTIGSYNNVTGDGGVAIGEGLNITGSNSFGIGRDVTNGSFSNSFIIGNRFLNPQAFLPTENDANGQMVMRFEGGYKFYTNDFPNTTQASGVSLAANGYSWETLSDRNSKENFTHINFQEVLNKLDKIPVTQWNYKTTSPSIVQWGPMAQDFKHYFGLGAHQDSLKITTLEMDGVLMAGVKGLIERSNQSNEKVEELQNTIINLQKELQTFKAENVSLKVENKNYEQRLKALESTVQNVLQVLESPKTTVRTVTSKK